MQRRRFRTLAIPAAMAVLLLTGCAQTVEGQARVGVVIDSGADVTSSMTETTDETPSAPETPSTSETPTSTLEPIPPVAPSESTIPTSQPTQTALPAGHSDPVGWVSLFCTGYAKIAEHSSPDVSGMTMARAVSVISDAYQQMSDEAYATWTGLADYGPPSSPGGPEFAEAAISWLVTIDVYYGPGADSIANGHFGDESELADAIDKIEQPVIEANQDFHEALAGADSEIADAFRTLPECAPFQ